MRSSNYGFYFEEAGRSAAQGAIAPAEQYFEGSQAEVSVVRETGQNSLDAVDGAGPVRMEFELCEMPTAALPGMQELRTHLARVVRDTEGTEGHDRMREAWRLAGEPTVSVLRISDYGTTGLKGSESVKEPRSPLSALTRGAGISANDGRRGGSFGIGSAVGPMASGLCTVFYSSMPSGTSEIVFTGHSRLATHADEAGVLRVGDGFYTDLTVTNDFRYLRNPGSFGPFDPRTQPGTDIFITGYRKAGEDGWLHNIRDAFVDNFMMAIHRGKLQVSGKGNESTWHLDSETLATHVEERPETLAFYRAVGDPHPAVKKTERFGDIKLYINVDPSLPKTLHTITMRRPLMRIDTFRHTSIPVKYAAVLECSDPEGNKLLRGLEPPQHDRWDSGRADDGMAAIAELKTFVRQELRARVKEQIGDIMEIKGLARFLPSGPSKQVGGEDGAGGRPGRTEGGSEESAFVQGDPEAAVTPKLHSGRRVPVRVQRAAKSTGGRSTTEGTGSGGTRQGKPGQPGNTGSGEAGNGRARISAGQVLFRSWSAPSAIAGRTTLQVALTSQETVSGDIELVALGAGGAIEPGYELPILSAHAELNGTRNDVRWEGNVFKDVRLLEGQTTRLEVELRAGHRYRLDVK